MTASMPAMASSFPLSFSALSVIAVSIAAFTPAPRKRLSQTRGDKWKVGDQCPPSPTDAILNTKCTSCPHSRVRGYISCKHFAAKYVRGSSRYHHTIAREIFVALAPLLEGTHVQCSLQECDSAFPLEFAYKKRASRRLQTFLVACIESGELPFATRSMLTTTSNMEFVAIFHAACPHGYISYNFDVR
jgi:hypothetical protein